MRFKPERLFWLILAIALFLIGLCLRGECIDLGVVDSTHGFNFMVPKNRSDIMGLELCFMPRTEPTNSVTITLSKAQAENMTMTGDTIPNEVTDGRVVVGFRWVLTSGRKGKWRLGAFDLWRNEPEPPSATQTFVSSERGVESRHAHQSEASGRQATEGKWRTVAPSVSNTEPGENQVGVAPNRSEYLILNEERLLERLNARTNDAPVRAWHGAMIDPGLQAAIAAHFNKPIQLPPMPPATNGMQHRFWGEPNPVKEIKQKARDEMMEFMKHGAKDRPVPNSMSPVPKIEGSK